MEPLNFCYWLRGYIELDGATPSPEQWSAIADHLDLVFKKVTPQYQFPQTPRLGDIKLSDMQVTC